MDRESLSLITFFDSILTNIDDFVAQRGFTIPIMEDTNQINWLYSES